MNWKQFLSNAGHRSEEEEWAPASTAYWIEHYGTSDLEHILRRLHADFPKNTYRIHNGTLECLIVDDEEE